MQKDFLVKSLDVPLGQIMSYIRKHSTLFKNSHSNCLIKFNKEETKIKYSRNEMDKKSCKM